MANNPAQPISTPDAWLTRHESKTRAAREDAVAAIEKGLDEWDGCAPLVFFIPKLTSYRPGAFAALLEYQSAGWPVEHVSASNSFVFSERPKRRK